MKNLFAHTSALWIRYSGYEYKTADDDTLYITVSEGAEPEMDRPMQEAEQLITDVVLAVFAYVADRGQTQLRWVDGAA